MAGTLPKINWFKDYPEHAVMMCNRILRDVIEERRSYPLKPKPTK